MEINVIRVVYYGLCMIGISWYMLNRMEDELCKEDLYWFIYVSVLMIYIIPAVMEVVWKII